MSEDNNVSNNVETNETTNAAVENNDANVVLENNTSNVNTQFITPNDSTPLEAKKKSKALPICIVLIVALCICLGGFYFYFSTPKKIVSNVINKAYEKYDEIANKDVKFDIAKDSVKVEGNLNFDTNIPGFDTIKNDVIKFTGGIDYKNKKAEGGLSLDEKNKTLADIMAYVIDGNAYMTLGDDYKGLVNVGKSDFEDVLNLEDLEKTKIDKDDINYVVKAYKDILIDSIDKKDLEKSSDTIKIDGKDTKVTKISYKVNKKNLEKLSKNIIDKTLSDKELLKKLAKITDTDVEDIKDSLKEAKDDLEIEDEDLNMTLNIYTKGFMNDFVGLDLKIDKDNSLNVVVNKDNTKVTIKAGNEMTFVATIKEYNDEKIDIDYNVKVATTTVSGNLTITAKETKKDHYKGSLNFTVKYAGFNASVKMDYTMEIGAKIADINTSKAVDQNKAYYDLQIASNKILNRLQSSNIGTIISSFADSFEEEDDDDDYSSYNYDDEDYVY
ncbi:MAG: hypothetical protein E7158_02705 [Firmicutes bacterium]|nr:hypothetical protein [Bacillota bacterium]